MSVDPDAIKSFVSGIRELEKVRRECDKALATIGRVQALLPKWQADRATYPLDDIRASVAFLAVKACEKELKAALKEPSS